ncbi:MAG: hypothetical protein KAT43_01395 [Nanoarchaeota archaeon]|nr:hypothetical protein [Nanoarchaeota archaeon]
MTQLTKSAYMKGQQCQRLLWFADKNQLPKASLSDQHKFDQGHDFEKLNINMINKELLKQAIKIGGRT